MRGTKEQVAMTSLSPPATVDVARWLDQRREVLGVLPVAGMARLCELLTDDRGSVDVALKLGRDIGRRPVISGELHLNVWLLCQRCLQAFEWRATLPVSIGIVASEAEAEALPESLDPLIVDDGELRLHALIEDEVILGLPIVARHPDEVGCLKAPRSKSQPQAESKPNPFAALESLKRRDD
ncbi:YceD family protein [Natronocella acetinitrilica]|nr:YceD family protein [Natronocella acetinitrilica]